MSFFWKFLEVEIEDSGYSAQSAWGVCTQASSIAKTLLGSRLKGNVANIIIDHRGTS